MPNDERDRLLIAQRLVAVQAECDQRMALRLMIDRGLVQRLPIDQLVDGVLDGSIRFAT